MNAPTYIQISNLSKHYPGVEALKSINFNIKKGEVHALVGENGAGKSTLIKILSGAIQANAGGVVSVNGERYAPQSPKEAIEKGIATIYQIFNLLPDRSITHNVMLGKEIAKRGVVNTSQMRRSTQKVLASLNAEYLNMDVSVGGLKVGEKQIVEIAKALVNESELLIMDEPTAALNQREVEALFDNVKKLRKRGVTIIYVSHRLDEIYELADSVTVLRDGQHILTRPISQVSREELIESMIGRKLENVFPAKEYNQGKEILAVEHLTVESELVDISFNLQCGEVLAITGLSGCGKTDLGKALYGAVPAQRGSILINHHQLRVSPQHCIRHRIILLPEDRKEESMLHELSIQRNLSLSVLGSRVANKLGFLNRKKEAQIATEQIRSLEIKASSLEQNVMHLSGGNQQKVALGRCLAVDPQIFILLEPTQGIDVGVKFELYQFIVTQAVQGKAVILITSELTEVMGLSHRVLVMHEGRIVADLATEKTNQAEILRFALGEEDKKE